jgi:hypothetical protein
MYAMALIFLGLPLGAGSSLNWSAAQIFPSKTACEEALPGVLNYQSGREAGRGNVVEIHGVCVPVIFMNDKTT